VAKKHEITIPLIENVAQHELGLRAHMEATEREAAQRVEVARREAEALLRQAQIDAEREAAELKRIAEEARGRAQQEIEEGSRAQAECLRAAASVRAAEVVAAIMDLVLPHGERSAGS